MPNSREPWQTLLVLGPTCSGKSAVALILAQSLGTDLISCDSMQVYRGMDIGTAKPSTSELALVQHHLVDNLSLDQRYDANQFVQLSSAIIEEQARAGRKSLVAGGTGLYARALVYGYQLLPADRNVAAEILDHYHAPGGPESLRQEIAMVAPESADRLALNPRHLMRAVEVLRLTGGIPDQLRIPTGQLPPRPGFRQFILMPEPQWHRERIRERTREMLASGWIQETRHLLLQGLLQSPTARQALGYREIAAWLESGEANPGKLLETLFHKTVQYARRQRTWFRHQHPGAIILPVGPGDTPRGLAEAILDHLA